MATFVAWQNSTIADMSRNLRKVPSSPLRMVSPSSSKERVVGPDNSFIKLLQTFVSQVLT